MSCEFVHKHLTPKRQNYYYFIGNKVIAGFENGKEKHLHQNNDNFKR
jgi:hypothetical protein